MLTIYPPETENKTVLLEPLTPIEKTPSHYGQAIFGLFVEGLDVRRVQFPIDPRLNVDELLEEQLHIATEIRSTLLNVNGSYRGGEQYNMEMVRFRPMNRPESVASLSALAIIEFEKTQEDPKIGVLYRKKRVKPVLKGREYPVILDQISFARDAMIK